MKLQTLKSIIEKKRKKSEFAIITNLSSGESEIFEKDKPLSKEMEIYSNQINEFFNSKKNQIIFIGLSLAILISLVIFL